MKKIGFIDHYISEWHANNYPAWISEVSDEYRVKYAWASEDVSPVTGETTDQWCSRMGVARLNSIEELCEKSDVIVILAPSSPETHLDFAEVALRYGKPTYIDKTFAPDAETAIKIFSLAEKYGAPMFSSSALRYADEYATTGGYDRIITTGGGSNAPEYIIHQAETVVKHLGVGAVSVRCEKRGDEAVFFVTYPDSRSAVMIYGEAYGFTSYLAGGEGKSSAYVTVNSAFFNGLIRDMVRFFKEGTTSFEAKETVEVIRIREGCVKALEALGCEIALYV